MPCELIPWLQRMDNGTSTQLYVVMCHQHRVWGTGNCSLIYDDDDDDINLLHKNINAQKHKYLI
jgi:hypothetical protein